MIGFFVLSATTQVLLIISSLVFFLAAGLQLIGIGVKRKAPLITRFLGFFLLAVVTLSPILTFINNLTAAIITIVSAFLITFSYILLRMQNPHGDVSEKVSSHISLNTPKSEPVSNTKDINPPQAKSSDSPYSLKSDIKPTTGKQQQSVQAVVAPVQTVRSAIKKETGIRSEPLVHLPAQRRKKARTVVNTLIGFVVFFLVGWGSYTIAKRIIKPQESLDTGASQIDEVAPPVSQDNIQLNEMEEDSAEEVTPAEEIEDSTEDQEEVEVVPKDMLTIKDTETGWLNVREGSSIISTIITKIDPGDTYEFLGENEGGTWYKIQVDDETAGWISAKYADKDE